MVTRRWSRLAGLAIAASLLTPAGGPLLAQDAASTKGAASTSTSASAQVTSALTESKFPWYDSAKDVAKPGAIPREVVPETPTSGRGGASVSLAFGDVLTIVLMVLGLGVLVGLLAWLYRHYQPVPGEPGAKPKLGPGSPARIEALPEGMRPERSSGDPWTEMLRHRDRGNWNEAILELFVHQLLALHRRDLIRLAPGRTARQLVRSIKNSELTPLITPTLRLFEAVYYGRRQATKADFDALWPHAQAFERRIASEVRA